MKSPQFRTLATAVLLGLAGASAVLAQTATPTPAQQKELDAARADLDRAALRVAELSQRFGAAEGTPIRIERRLLRKPVLGVLFSPDAEAGVRIAGVTPGSGAAEAGLKSGDRLVSIDGARIAGQGADARLDNAREALRGLDTRTPVRIGYARAGREAAVTVTPKLDDRIALWDAQGDGRFKLDLDMLGPDMEKHLDALRGLEGGEFAGIAPDVHTEIIRLRPDGRCEGERCSLPMLTEAFRWSGLNLASVDPQLGRYFGADDGVLVLSTGGELEGLQAGDVIEKIDGKPVESPRQAMAALRAKPADSRVRVDYRRDRKQATAQVKVPDATPFRMPAPPAPPAPPTPPPPPVAGMAPQPPSPPAAPHGAQPHAGQPHAVPHAVHKRRIVTIDADGNRHEWEDDGTTPPPPGTRRVEQRRMVYIDDNGKRTVIEGDAAPAMPPPPAPPAPPAVPARGTAAPLPPAPPPPPAPPSGS